MTTTEVRSPRITTVDADSESVDGYVILKAIADMWKVDKFYCDPDWRDGGCIVTIGVQDLRLKITADDGASIEFGQPYGAVALTVVKENSIMSKYRVDAVLRRFTKSLQCYVGIAKKEPAPESMTRICAWEHGSAPRQVVRRDEDLDFWCCPYSGHGILFDEDTMLVPTDPFKV